MMAKEAFLEVIMKEQEKLYPQYEKENDNILTDRASTGNYSEGVSSIIVKLKFPFHLVYLKRMIKERYEAAGWSVEFDSTKEQDETCIVLK